MTPGEASLDESTVGKTRLRKTAPYHYKRAENTPIVYNTMGVAGPRMETEKQALRGVPPSELKDTHNRFVESFRKVLYQADPMESLNYYERRKQARDMRRMTIWCSPNEYSYKPPLHPPVPNNPRAGIHPESDLSWRPAPTPPELPVRYRGGRANTAYGASSL